jgi:predicted nucleotidyltransferase
MNFGLPAELLKQIVHIVKKSDKNATVKIFGSRAMGRHSPASDVDLAVFGELDELAAARISSELDELPYPYKFDVIVYSLIENSELKDHIDRVGKIL